MNPWYLEAWYHFETWRSKCVSFPLDQRDTCLYLELIPKQQLQFINDIRFETIRRKWLPRIHLYFFKDDTFDACNEIIFGSSCQLHPHKPTQRYKDTNGLIIEYIYIYLYWLLMINPLPLHNSIWIIDMIFFLHPTF